MLMLSVNKTTIPSNSFSIIEGIEAVLKFPPIFQLAKTKAREKIINKGLAIDVKWEEERDKLASAMDWIEQINKVENEDIVYPEYYTQPFHGYDQGNLCLEAALEIELASDCVHADVMDPDRKILQKDGDWTLRRSYHTAMKEILMDLDVQDLDSKLRILDVGCSSGRSSRALLEAFPNSQVTGIELSPYFLAVGKYLQQQRESSGKSENLTLVHGIIEENEFPDESFDMVSICLVFHEMPQRAILNVLKSAKRVLSPGGLLCIMEMDPLSPRFTKLFQNPVAFAGFKSTEPWLLEYATLPLEEEISRLGFKNVTKKRNSPGHKTVVAIKA